MNEPKKEGKKVKLSDWEMKALLEGIASAENEPLVPLEEAGANAKRRTRAWMNARKRDLSA